MSFTDTGVSFDSRPFAMLSRRTATVLGGDRRPHQLLPRIEGLTPEHCQLLKDAGPGDLLLLVTYPRPEASDDHEAEAAVGQEDAAPSHEWGTEEGAGEWAVTEGPGDISPSTNVPGADALSGLDAVEAAQDSTGRSSRKASSGMSVADDLEGVEPTANRDSTLLADSAHASSFARTSTPPGVEQSNYHNNEAHNGNEALEVVEAAHAGDERVGGAARIGSGRDESVGGESSGESKALTQANKTGIVSTPPSTSESPEEGQEGLA